MLSSSSINRLTFLDPPLLLCNKAPPEDKHQDPGEELYQGDHEEAGQHQGEHGRGQTQLPGPEQQTGEAHNLQQQSGF